MTSIDLTQHSVSDLFTLALSNSDDEGGSEGWNAISELHRRGTEEIFMLCQSLCHNSDPHERRTGADILGQLGWHAGYPYLDQTLPILFHLIETDQNTQVLNSACIALGHLGDERAIEPLLTLKDHPNDIVRYGVIVGLFGFEDERAIAALIELSRDTDVVNRDWATSALGTLIDSDTEAIREALYARLDDTDEVTCSEAIKGLVLRKDERLMPWILARLEQRPNWILPLEAAEDLADPRLLPTLYRFRDHWVKGETRIYMALRDAIAACEGKQTPG